MATDEHTTTRDRVTTTLRALETGDTVAAASTYANDGVLIDPQYPEPEYEGRKAIREAYDWALTNLVEHSEFTIRSFIEEDGTCAVEVTTHHVAKDGTKREFPQVFIVKDGPEGITRWQTYLPFPPK